MYFYLILIEDYATPFLTNFLITCIIYVLLFCVVNNKYRLEFAFPLCVKQKEAKYNDVMQLVNYVPYK